MSKSIEKQKSFSASEIAAMNLPGLPKTIANIHARAKSEVWHYETKVGLGGVRKMYEIPAYYLPGYKLPEQAPKISDADRITAKATETFGSKIDPVRLSQAIRFLDAFLLEQNKQLSPERKSEVIIVLYNYLKSNDSKEEVEQLLKLVA
ncbi:DNA-binding protein [Undibacterium sp. Xuan67W]|uniref:DNA-binding protein n=1 Tax=Undibacterium sp. Xuan67W TaxID=3413057 RepID=UPI003BF43F53